MSKLSSVVTAALLVAAVVVFAWQVERVGNLRMDDALITFSFSKNVALGNGPVYSHGVRVEGYSNFFWMVLVAGPLRFFPNADPFLVARVLAVPFLGLLAWALFRLVQNRANAMWAGVAVLLLAFNSDLAASFLSGLETVPYAALLALGFMFQFEEEPRKRALSIPMFVLASLMRIDGALMLLFALAVELILWGVAMRKVWRLGGTLAGATPRWAIAPVQLYAALGSGAVYSVWFIWRWVYYGFFFPSTYYAKSGIAEAAPKHGTEYVLNNFTSWGIWLLLPLAVVALARRGRMAPTFIAFSLLLTWYVRHVGGDWMPFGRFLIPLVAPVIALAVIGLSTVVDMATAQARRAAVAVALAGLGVLFAVAVRGDRHSVDSPEEQRKIDFANAQIPYMEVNLFPAAKMLAHVIEPGERLVSDYTGAFAYYTDAAVIDMWGLANSQIARRGSSKGVNPIFGKTCPECYPELDPEYFHVNVPMLRAPTAFKNHNEVVKAVWQSGTIGKSLDLKSGFVAGRITDPATTKAVFFLEKRRPGRQYEPRQVAGHMIDYPFAAANERVRRVGMSDNL